MLAASSTTDLTTHEQTPDLTQTRQEREQLFSFDRARLAATTPAFEAPVAMASQDVTMNNNTDSNVLPCPHFEGVEKRVEIDFHDGSREQGASPGLSRCAFAAMARIDATR